MTTIMLLLASFLFQASYATDPTPGDPKTIEEKFKSTFPNASNVTWHQDGSDYLAYFKTGKVTIKVILNASGDLVSYLRYYTEEELPFYIYSKILKKYPGLTILGITEFYSNNNLSYWISLTDTKDIWNSEFDANGNLTSETKMKSGATRLK